MEGTGSMCGCRRVHCVFVSGIPHQDHTMERFADLGFFGFPDYADLWHFQMGFRVCEGVQSIDASCRVRMDGFSNRTEPPGSMFDDLRDFVVGIVLGTQNII